MIKEEIRIAAMGDLHMQQGYLGTYRQIFKQLSHQADILLLCGDLTDEGLSRQAEMLAEELEYCKIPVIGVLGNHDFANDQQEKIKSILSPRMFILSNHPYIYQGIGFAGTKGFAGGFDNHLVTPFGERILKQFVDEAVKEVIRLEEALTTLRTDKKIVVLHYSPISQTLKGEPLEIYPFLGTSRLVEPIDNFGVSAVFHGHAHYGTPRGQTNKGVPVYNVSLSVMSRLHPDQPYLIVKI